MPKKKIPPNYEITIAIRHLCNRSRQLTFEQIEKDTGIPASWLSMFARGKISDPAYTRFVTLRDYLTKI
jgi:hypothetical protein